MTAINAPTSTWKSWSQSYTQAPVEQIASCVMSEMPRRRHGFDGRVELELEQRVGMDVRAGEEIDELVLGLHGCMRPAVELREPAEIEHRRLDRERLERAARETPGRLVQ